MAPKPPSGPSGPAAKRQKTDNPVPNARGDAFNAKRSKLITARTIPAQPATAALKDGELDLQAFVAAHEFEIRSLEQSMATSKAVATSRAFQQVPRGLRRRTASHNPKRIPKRLRSRAWKEMSEDNTPMVEARTRRPRTTRARIRAETARRLGILAARARRKRLKNAEATGQDPITTKKDGVVGRKPRPKIRRNQLNQPLKPPAKFRKRQINKTWLPTHLWHAKRARMTEPRNPLWRFAIPLTPNEKIYRPTHRAQGHKGAVLWDMSYMSTIGLYGNPVGLERVLQRIGLTQDSCWNNKGANWRLGIRSWTGLLSRQVLESRRFMCPATIFWNPQPQQSELDSSAETAHRQLFLRLHPSAFLEVFKELLRLVKMENPRVWVEDLRFEVGSIEITGPGSTEALLAVLTPYSVSDKEQSKHAELFSALRGLTNPATLPSNTVLGFSIQDPRLRYPPRRVEWSDDEQSEMRLLETVSQWPAQEKLEPYDIFDRDIRHKASILPSQKAISRRRTTTAPGRYLAPTESDPPIPVTLLASRSGSGPHSQGTWTLMAPWKCILPIWYSLVHCPLSSGGNPRFAGLDQIAQVAFERGAPCFPADFIWTDAGAEWEADQRQKRKRDWERRPKSKRVEWKSLDLGAGRKGELGDGLACDFELLFGLPKVQQAETTAEIDGDAMDVDIPSPQPSSSGDESPASSLRLLNLVPKSTYSTLLSSDAEPSITNGIINVRVTLTGRGTVGTCARVYRLPSKPIVIPTSSDAEVPLSIPHPSTSPTLPHDLRAQWLARLASSESSTRSKYSKTSHTADIDTRKRQAAQDLVSPPPESSAWPANPRPNQRDIGGCHPLVPDDGDLVGFVTSGSYNLSLGSSSAIASLALEKVLVDARENPKHGQICIVRNAGENVGWIAKWEVM